MKAHVKRLAGAAAALLLLPVTASICCWLYMYGLAKKALEVARALLSQLH